MLHRELSIDVESEHAVVEGRGVERDELGDSHPSAGGISASAVQLLSEGREAGEGTHLLGTKVKESREIEIPYSRLHRTERVLQK